MEPLNKLTLNNKIINMRHSVKQSRIQAINKLVKEIKKLRNKKGTDEQKAKNASKADRWVELIQFMKKIKDDDISKFALTNEKSLAQITNNVDEIPEIKAIARISSHRPIFEKVKSFREQYPDWKETLPILFETLGEKHLNKKKKPKPSVDSQQKKVKTKNSNQEQKPPSNVTYIHDKVGTWMVEDISNDSETENDSRKKSVKKEEKNNQIISFKTKTNHNQKSNQGKKQEVPSSDSESSTNDSAEISETSENHVNQSKTEDLPVENITKTVDPFFVTKDNKEYLSVNVINNPTNSEEKKPDFSQDKFKERDFSNKKFIKKDFSNNKFGGKDFSNKKFGGRDFSNKKFGDKSRQESSENDWKQIKIPVKREYPILERKEVALHPSWEAKRKQTSIASFQGKKIKFDD